MTRINLVKDKNGDMLADTHSTHSGQKDYLSAVECTLGLSVGDCTSAQPPNISPLYADIFL
jgi:hypothetical protein